MRMGRRGGRNSTPHPRRLTLLFATVVALLCVSTPAADGAEPHKLVVVIYPDESDGAPGIVLVNRAIRSTFASEAPGQIEVRNEYVDTSRLPDTDFARDQVSLLRRKYAGRKVDLVIAGLSSGLDFAVKHRDELFPGAPVVFVAVDEREVKARRLPPHVVGSPIRMDLTGTLDLAVRLHPDTRRVFVIAGKAPFDADWAAEARQTFRPYEDRLEFVYLTGLPMAELLDQVAGLPEQSIIYYLHIFQDGAGTPFFPADALERLAARANAPAYGHVDTYIGRGAVGGRVFTFEAEGTTAARLGLRLLAGQKPESVPLSAAGENTYLFDWRQLRRWGIDEKNLPPGSVVLHKEPTFWAAYRWHVVGATSLCAVEALLIVGLLVQRVKRRRAEVSVRESEARFRLMADATPILVWAAGVDKRCTYLNRPWLEFTGRPLEQELGDGWAGGVHPDDLPRCLAVYTSHFDARVPFEVEYRLRRHDGEYRWVVDRGVPRLSPGGEFAGYIGACTDITERRWAEDQLRASRQELQLLTRRLMEAQEDERRRIARELHDDVNQGLALLAVEIDLLAQRQPGSAEQTADRLRGLSARAKELSSSVHDLSHQLHPSKLEQLGLVAAVRGLCRELDQHHGLEVRFTNHGMREVVPEDVALCLYRIVQEALRNVIRHSGTCFAVVELIGTPNGIRLRVGDDGAGFDPGSIRGREGLGLVSMRERLRLVGGELRIDSRPSCGTRIEVHVPTPARGAAECSLRAEVAESRRPAPSLGVLEDIP